MKIVHTASGRSLKMSKKEWHDMGKDAGWIKRSDEEDEIQDTPTAPSAPMGWDPSGVKQDAQEEAGELQQKTEADLWANINVSFETKKTKYGDLTFVVLSGASKPLSSSLKELGYRAFKNRISGEWTWSKTVNQYKSSELDLAKLDAIKAELTPRGVDVSALASGPVSVDAPVAREEAQEVSIEEADVPEEMIYWHNEMEAARKLKPDERKKKYSDIIFGALGQIGDQAELDASSEQSQAIIKSLLTASSKFHNYSFWNSMMIAVTKPTASYVASQDNWKRMGRVPKKGATKIPIMFPRRGRTLTDDEKATMTDQEARWKSRTSFGLGTALAYSDTDPVPGWVAKRGKFKGQGPFEPPVWQVDSQEATEWLTQLYSATFKWATETKKFKVGLEGMDTAGGYASSTGKIAINDKSEGIVKISTLFHEIAHQLIHFDPDFQRSESTKQDRETDAESTAYVVCSHYHIETKDTPIYLAGFGANKDKILSRFNYIRKAAIEMFEGIDTVMSGMQLMQGSSPQDKEMEPDELPTVDSTPEETLSIAGNIFGSLGLFKYANVLPVPFTYDLDSEIDNEDQKDII